VSATQGLRAVVRSARPHQWVKNAFVAVPFVFAGPELHASGQLGAATIVRTLLAVVGFCLASSATYLMNDLHDAAADRLHPVKRLRPIAAGSLPEAAARRWIAALVAIAAAAGWFAGWQCLLWLALYFAVNLAYSKGLKRIAWIDAAVISGGFLIRIAAGAAATDVHVSHWLLACTGLLSLYLALGKRKHELLTSGGNHRAALAAYRESHLNHALGVLAAVTVFAYLGYTLDEATVARFHTRKLPWTVAFAVFGLWRYAVLLDDDDTAHSPTERMLRDPAFLLNLGLWSAAVSAIIYGVLDGDG
jgi:4-hydroxybenzoate polyprenyltransferase